MSWQVVILVSSIVWALVVVSAIGSWKEVRMKKSLTFVDMMRPSNIDEEDEKDKDDTWPQSI